MTVYTSPFCLENTLFWSKSSKTKVLLGLYGDVLLLHNVKYIRAEEWNAKQNRGQNENELHSYS